MDLDHKELSCSMRAHGRLPVFGNKSRGAHGFLLSPSYEGHFSPSAKGHAMPTRGSMRAPARDAPALADEPEHFLNRHQAARADEPALAFIGVHQRSDHNTGRDKHRGLRRKADRHSHHRDRRDRREALAHGEEF